MLFQFPKRITLQYNMSKTEGDCKSLQATNLETQNDIINILRNFGDVIYGFSYVDIAPNKIKHLPYAITIGLPLLPIVNNIVTGPNQAYYDEYLSVNDRLDLLTEQLKMK